MRAGRIWLLGGALLAVGVIALGWLVGASPLLATAAENERQTQEIEAQNAAEELAIARMKKQFENIDDLRAELDELQVSVPGFADTGTYLEELAVKAALAGVALQSVEFEGAQPYGAMGSTTASTDEAEDGAASAGTVPPPLQPGTSLQGSLYVVSVGIQVDADAAQLALFLALLQDDGRLILVTDVDSSFGATQRAKITGHVFVVHDPRRGPVGSLPKKEEAETPAPAATEPAQEESADDAATTEETPGPGETPAG